MPESILFVTGKLAELSLRRVVGQLAESLGFSSDIAVLRITVAALMHTEWVARHLKIEGAFDRVILPGWCQGNPEPLTRAFGVPFEKGPKDLLDLTEYLHHGPREAPDLSQYDIEILAEINHAPRMSDREIVDRAQQHRAAGADVIDLGCVPGESWNRAGAVTALLRSQGFRVSIDSFDQSEVELAVDAGAELVLSCRAENVDWCADLAAEIVVLPDDPRDLSTLEPSVAKLDEQGTRYRIDPVMEPIGFGFAASLERYFEARRKWPEAALMMGIGNLTELTEVDSAGVNVLLAAVCQELSIGSVLTTEVINWCRTAVAEFDVARRLMKHAIDNGCLPKHIDSRLVMLRDPQVHTIGGVELTRLSRQIKDANFRVFVDGGEIHLMNRNGYWHGTDPYMLFDRAAEVTELSPSHSFYLGFELCQARTALTLGKQYRQDDSLDWGMLTVAQPSALERRRIERSDDASEPAG